MQVVIEVGKNTLNVKFNGADLIIKEGETFFASYHAGNSGIQTFRVVVAPAQVLEIDETVCEILEVTQTFSEET